MAYLDLRDLANELNELERQEEDGELDGELGDDERDRLAALRELQGELFTDTLAEYAENEPTMIPEEEFEEHAEELAYDIGYAKRDDNNPLHTHIDWGAWAEDVKQDYQEVAFAGDTYLIRAY